MEFVKTSRMKPLPHGVCQKLSKPVPTRSSRHVEQLCFLVQRNPTVRLPGALERRYSLSKRKITKWLLNLHSSFHVFFSFVCIPTFFFSFFSFSYLIFPSLILLISLPFSLSFSPHFLLSLCISLLLFGALTVWSKRRKFPPLLPQAKCVAFHFPSFSFIS